MGEDGDACCCACLEPTRGRLRPCGHSLCEACAERWFSVKLSCPVCRGCPFGHSLIVSSAPCVCSATCAPSWRRRWRCYVRRGLGIVLSETASGVRITGVESWGMGWRMGLRTDDVILDVNGLRVGTCGDVCRLIASSLADAPRIEVGVRPAARRRRRRFVGVHGICPSL